MNGLPYYRRYPRDLFEGTIGMPFELKGAYSLLLDLIYLSGGALPDDPKYISGHLGCSVRAWNIHRASLISRGKILCDLGVISNFRADKEMIISRSFQDKQRENATQPRKIKGLDLAMAEPKPSHTIPDTEKKEEKSRGAIAPRAKGTRLPSDWFLPKAWGEWAVAEGHSIDLIRVEAENFKDYWNAKSGAGATKLDWEATWRVWIRKTPKGKINGNGTGSHQRTANGDATLHAISVAARNPRTPNPSWD